MITHFFAYVRLFSIIAIFILLDGILLSTILSELSTGMMLHLFPLHLTSQAGRLTIIISCLGLFGLSTFTVQRRIKEIGIRKVLGSSDLGIVQLLSGEFTRTVLTAIGIALPLSYLITSKWLNEFVYRIDLEWWFFVLAGLLCLLIAWVTVGIQTLKASRINPVNCLKEE